MLEEAIIAISMKCDLCECDLCAVDVGDQAVKAICVTCIWNEYLNSENAVSHFP